MSAIKDKIQWYQYLVDANREKGIIDASLERDLDVTKEISDRLDALEAKAHEHNPPVSVVSQSPMPVEVPPSSTLYTGDTERSCMKCRSYNGCQATAEELGSALPEKGCADYEPKPDTEPSCDEPAQEQGGDDKDYDALLKKYQDLMAWYDNHSGTPCEQIRHEHEVADLRARLEQAEKEIGEWEARLSSILVTGILDDYTGKDVRSWLAEYKSSLEQAKAKVKELTAELEKQKASAFETGELALKRGFEIERLEKEQGDILFLVQTRLQPPGSPCPGGPVMLVTWITGEAVKKIERLEKENAELKNQPIAVRCVDKKCDDCPIAPIEIFNKLRAENAELKRQLKSEVK